MLDIGEGCEKYFSHSGGRKEMNFRELLINIAENNYLNLFVGIFLCYCGLNEAWGALHEDIRSLNFGAHHGIIVIGLINTFKSLSHIIKGTKT